MLHFRDLPSLSNDGLPIAEVGAWSEEKYRLIQHYASLFCRAMRSKWGSLVYLDIFAGPGYAKFKGTSRIVAASPMIALGLEDRFDRYIFCEAESTNAIALEQRCARDHPEARIHVVNDDANMASRIRLRRSRDHERYFAFDYSAAAIWGSGRFAGRRLQALPSIAAAVRPP